MSVTEKLHTQEELEAVSNVELCELLCVAKQRAGDDASYAQSDHTSRIIEEAIRRLKAHA